MCRARPTGCPSPAWRRHKPRSAPAATALLDALVSDAHELLTVIVGDDADEATTAAIEDHMSEHHPDVEVDVSDGGQPLYPYYFGLE